MKLYGLRVNRLAKKNTLPDTILLRFCVLQIKGNTEKKSQIAPHKQQCNEKHNVFFTLNIKYLILIIIITCEYNI